MPPSFPDASRRQAFLNLFAPNERSIVANFFLSAPGQAPSVPPALIEPNEVCQRVLSGLERRARYEGRNTARYREWAALIKFHWPQAEDMAAWALQWLQTPYGERLAVKAERFRAWRADQQAGQQGASSS